MDRHCPLCTEPDSPVSMIDCARCQKRYHHSCAGVQDDNPGTSSTYYCRLCVPRDPAPSVSMSKSASTTASAREARLQLEMLQLEEEKRVHEMLMVQRAEAEKQLQERAMQLERERSEKAIAEKIELEKVFITRKYDLLRAQVEESEDGRSVRSRRSSVKSIEKVQRWIDKHPVTLTSNSGDRTPTGTTSQQGISSTQLQPPITTLPSTSGLPNHQSAAAINSDASKDQSSGAAGLPSSGLGVPSEISPLGPTTGAANLLPAYHSTPLAPPAATSQPAVNDVVRDDQLNRTYSAPLNHLVSTDKGLEAAKMASAASVNIPAAINARLVNPYEAINYPAHQQGMGFNPVPAPSCGTQAVNFNTPTAQQLAARHVVPKELPQFSGNPAEWPLFWSSYETSTNICGYSEAENLMRLQRCLKGEARKAVNCFLLHPMNVPEIIRTLSTLYGRPESIIGTLLAEVRAAPAPRSEKLESVINFGLVVRNLCAHLVATGQEMHLANPMLVNELVDKLPANIKLDWALYTQRAARADLRTFSDYMNVIVDAASRVTPVMDKPRGKAVINTHASTDHGGRNQGDYKPAATRPDFNKPQSGGGERPCMVCKTSGHKPKDCSSFKSKSLENRWKIAQELHLCRRCLYPHGKWPCKAPMCGTDGCGQRHHRLLHPGNPEEERQPAAPSNSVSRVVNVHQHCHNKVLFRIVPVELHANGRSVQTFAFLDGGSDTTLVEKSLVEQLALHGPVSPLCMQWTNGVKRMEEDSMKVQIQISGVGQRKQFQLRGVQTVESLDLPRQSLHFKELEDRFAYLRGLPVRSYDNIVPGILIGLDNTSVKNSLKQREGKEGEPVATKTRLGWVVYGCTGPTDQDSSHRVLHVCTRAHDDDLDGLIKQFFSTESVGVSVAKPVESADDQRARKILEATTVRTPSGRYQTGLLWKYDEFVFPNSRPMAERRLKCLERRLSKSPELYTKMRKQIADYQTKGYAHRASQRELEESDPNRIWYLPLGIVVNPRKPEKLRIIWDAAAVVQGVSFNSALLKGPDLLVPLQAVLCRYRQKEIAISADIMEMFHQVEVRPEDRQAQRFLWRDKPEDPIQVFVMDVVIFGSTCSPCSTQFAKNINAMEHSMELPEAAAAIIENHYVDDYLDSVDSVDEAVQLASDVRTVHARGGFQIRHWMSNSPEVLRRIGEQNSQEVKSFVMDKDSQQERILGMVWLPSEDVFSYTTSFRRDLERLFDAAVTPTKREVLRLVMSLFDPLGLVASFVIEGKVIIQEIWRSKVGWDEQIPGEILPRWQQWLEILRSLDKVKIPRCYFPGYSQEAYESLELHVFVDASESAFAAAAYFRVVDNGTIRCCLVSAKTKVAPLQSIGIPRLELQAATIGTRLMKTVTENHTIPIKRRVMWSDSKTVLAWLRSDHRRYRQFVAFRITEILEDTNVADWRWVPTKLNVADEATKWGKGPNYHENCRWFNGPAFLYEDEAKWPEEDSAQEEHSAEELRNVRIHVQHTAEPVVPFQRFSKWERLVRAIAYVRRFYQNCQHKRNGSAITTGFLSCEELNAAEYLVWKLVQQEVFPAEFDVLRSNLHEPSDQREAVEKSSSIYKLAPFLGEGEVIRKDSRIKASPFVSYNTKFPIIVPKQHYVTHLLVNWYHRQYGHANGETVVNEIRQKYHIPKLRVIVRKTAKCCTWCSVYRCVPQVPRMGPLPIARLTPYVRAFTFVGLDYFGPLTVRVGRASAKRWVALFTCLTTRAIHLEVATSLSTESCIQAIRRFIARRGAPQEVYSDQGTNFQGVSSELARQIRSINGTLAATITNYRTQWKFNPPYAPHMGGVWERLVRSVKRALSSLLTDRNPDDETLATALAEVESLVNSHPLTYLPLESEEHEALTPNHFLLLSSSGVVQPATKPTHDAEALRSNWGMIKVMLDNFWRRWLREYLPVMSPQSKWFGEVRNVQVGDLVMIANEKERNSWTRGRIRQVYPGRDGRVRRVDVQTTAGIQQRPVSKIAVLNVAEEVGIAEGSGSNTVGGMCATEPEAFSTTLTSTERDTRDRVETNAVN
ncbi:uncharacterized protein LOC134286107 [Aedes albopictus]|uniref:Endonuclease n=1 Tax=Aedes albopictus TaxID=7160 RepID=A0ABM1Z8D8_AEDAL